MNTCNPQPSKLLYPRLSTWGWPNGLEHNSRILLYKRLYKLLRDSPSKNFFPMSRLTQEKWKICTDELLTWRSNFLCFVTQAPLSKFKKLIVTISTLLRGLHRECKRIKLREPPPVPYVPVKDEVQDALNFAVWQENGTREAFFDACNRSKQCN